MSKKLPRFRDKKYSPKVLNLISLDRNLSPGPRTVSLNRKEVLILKKIVKGTMRPKKPFSMSRAITLLAQNEKSSIVCKILGKLVGDKD